MTGLIVVPDRLPVGLVVEDLLLMNNCREQAEWIGRVIYLPL